MRHKITYVQKFYKFIVKYNARNSIYIEFSNHVVAQSCPTLCDAMDCSPPGSSVYGIL